MNSPTHFYQRLLQAFVDTGEEPDLSLCENDALAQYLAQTMHDAQIKALVLNDEVAARVFVDTLSQFISLNLQKAAFQTQRVSFDRKQRQEASEWSVTKRRDNWQALLQMMDDKYAAQGFDKGFYQREFSNNEGYSDEALWETLLNDWEQHIDLRLQDYKRQFVKNHEQLQTLQLRNNLKNATNYVKLHRITTDRFNQAWALMGGQWNSLEFERLLHTVNFQQRYPILSDITNVMGRKADVQGNKRIGYTSGTNEQMEHAAQSDITGISLGRDLGALLPSEWAQYMDADLEDVFLQKYVTGRLQTFSYQSHALNSARSLHTKPARPKGAMVVCADRSGSMMGQPSEATLSLMMRLCEMCQQEQRPCYLIAFTTQAHPIEVLTDRTRLLQFFNSKADGGTDARHLLDELFHLLRTDAHYAGADVLWVSDFRIPLPERSYFEEIERLQQGGTRFYALQLGIAQNHWLPFFDKTYQIADIEMAVR